MEERDLTSRGRERGLLASFMSNPKQDAPSSSQALVAKATVANIMDPKKIADAMVVKGAVSEADEPGTAMMQYDFLSGYRISSCLPLTRANEVADRNSFLR